MKNPLTPAGIEPATFRFVAQRLNHCATAVPEEKGREGKWALLLSATRFETGVAWVNLERCALHGVIRLLWIDVVKCDERRLSIEVWSRVGVSFMVLALRYLPDAPSWRCVVNQACNHVPRNLLPYLLYRLEQQVDSIWNGMAHGDAREGKWRGNWRMQLVASTLHTTSEHGVSSITTADAHTSAASSRLNWRPPADLNGLVRFARKTKSGFCACAITFQLDTTFLLDDMLSPHFIIYVTFNMKIHHSSVDPLVVSRVWNYLSHVLCLMSCFVSPPILSACSTHRALL